jgi:hypothetical protein
MGETRVDLQHLLEDLGDAYPGAIEETILTEIIANSLDSGATRIELTPDPASTTLTVVDNGRGMSRAVLRRYHDIAASTKTRGHGIGFAGVGIKLGLLVSDEVVTESRRDSSHIATAWRLASRQRAPWRWVDPPGRVTARGTAIHLKLQNPLSPLLEPGFLTATVQRHFAPLLDAQFAAILAAHYPHGVRFLVNGTAVTFRGPAAEHVPVSLRVGRKRKPGAVGYLLRAAEPLPEEQRGVSISSLGKVIKQGWDWLGLTPVDAERIGGLIEVPALAECLTLNKTDFLRTGARGGIYLRYRRALQEAVSAQLAAWGAEAREDDAAHKRRARPVERDLQALLLDLVSEYPLLASLVDRHPGGQRSLPVGRAGSGSSRSGLLAGMHAEPVGMEPELTQSESPGSDAPQPPAQEAQPPASLPATPEGPAAPLQGRVARRPGRYSLSIQFEHRPDDSALGRLVESTVWVNDAHPAYERAVASRSEGYHLALTVAMTLAPLAVEAGQTHAFINTFLTHWGQTLGRKKRRQR